MSEHISDAELKRLVAGELSDDEVARWQQHFDACPKCNKRHDLMATEQPTRDGHDPSTFSTRTATTLLEHLKDPNNHDAWLQIDRRYRPIVLGMARGVFRLNAADAEEAAQQALSEFSNAYCRGKYDRERGRLRHWLRGIARIQIQSYMRDKYRNHDININDDSNQTGFFARLVDGDLPPDALEAMVKQWDRDWFKHHFDELLEQARLIFEPATIDAFIRYVVKEEDAQAIADDLGKSRNAVYLAKFKILGWMRENMDLDL